MDGWIHGQRDNFIYHINTSEIPSELSRENFISSHVKIYRLLHVKSLISFLFTSS